MKISSSLAFTRLVLTPMLQDFAKIHRELHLNFQLSDGFVDLVEQGIDLAIRHGEQADSSMRAIKIGASRRALYASPKYLKIHGRPRSVEDLRDHRLLYYNRISDKPCWPFNTLEGKPFLFNFNPYFQADGSDLVRELLLQGMGVTLSLTWMMIEPEKKGKVIRLLEECSITLIPIYLMTTGTHAITPKQRAMADFLKKRFGENPELSLS